MSNNKGIHKIIELLPWSDFQDVHLKKDPGLFPIYISREYEIPFEIVSTCTNIKKKTTESINENGTLIKFPTLKKRVISLKDPRRLFFLLPLIKYIWKNRKNKVRYILFHATDNTLTLAFFIKLFSPSSKIWLKLDASCKNLEAVCDLIKKRNTFKQKLISNRYIALYSKINIITAETHATFSILKNDSFFSTRNIELIPNGIEFIPNDTNFEKENIILSVARFGSPEKNTELFLSAISKLDLKDWTVYCVGTIENTFKTFLEDYFTKNSVLKNKIIFVGNINDKRTLNSYYSKAKVFVLPSRFESFGIATLEAAAFGDYLILTEVGAAKDFVKNNKYGIILPESAQERQNEDIIEYNLTDSLQKIINRQISVDEDMGKRLETFKNYAIQNIVKNQCISDWIK